MNVRPKNKTYLHINLLKSLKLYILYVRIPKQITYYQLCMRIKLNNQSRIYS